MFDIIQARMIGEKSMNKNSKYYNEIDTSAESRWNKKKVISSKTVYDVATMHHATFHGIGTFKNSSNILWNNKQTMCLEANTDIEDLRPRPSSTILIPFEKDDWRKYNRVSIWVYPKSVGFHNFYFHFSLFSTEDSVLHAPSLIPNVWNHVIFEIPLMKRKSVTRLSMGPLLMGCPPEAEPQIQVYFSDVVIERVEEDYALGWDTESRIAYSHIGYLTDAAKTAITKSIDATEFSLIDAEENECFKGEILEESTALGSFSILDFSDFQKEGMYAIRVGSKKSEYFPIQDTAYEGTIEKSIHFLHSLRCGDDIKGVHSPCHLTHHTMHPDGRLVSDWGGWHDAGDVSQFEICTAEMAHAILDLAQTVQYKNNTLYTRLMEEARWGLNWLLKTHFKDGYRALSIHYSVWRKYILESYQTLDPLNKDFPKDVAENGPFENFLAAAALAAGSRMFQAEDSVFAQWCMRVAIADFSFGLEGYQKGIFTKRWGKGPEVQVIGALCLAAGELYQCTKNVSYIETAAQYAPIISRSQQKEMPNWKTPIRGFFYEDPSHKTLFTFEHRGHEQSPITGIAKLLEVAPNHPQKEEWTQILKLYAEYCINTMQYTYPYNVLPAHIYQYEKLNMDRFTIPGYYKEKYNVSELLQNQIAQGVPLDKGIHLRIFPIAIQRRGFHATLLSKAKAVSTIGRLLKNSTCRQIAIDQLEWILGKNPFASSTMYGEGHNYHPLYVAFSQQIVGALPVGIQTFESLDKPYWPVINDAVYKEIWGHTTGKFLWVLSDLL